MCFKLKRDRYCDICLTAHLNQRYKCLRCQRSICAECYQENSEISEHSRSHPMQLLTNRRHSDYFIGGEPFPYMMASKFTCPICSLNGFDERGLVKHIEQEHNGNNELVFCPICIAMPNSSNASRVWSLWDHMRLHHLPSGNHEPLLSPLCITEIDESAEEIEYKGPNNSPVEDNDNIILFSDLHLTNIVPSDPAAIGANNIFEQMETDLTDYIGSINGDALPNENSATETHFSPNVLTTNHASLNGFQHSSNGAQLPIDIMNDGIMADEISSNGFLSELMVDPYEVNHQAFVYSNRFVRFGHRAIGTSSNELHSDGSRECHLNGGYAYNGFKPRTMPSVGQFIRSNAELNNDVDADNMVGNGTFVLPRLWPQYANEEITMANAISRNTEAIDTLSENDSSNEPSESNDNNL